MKTFRATLYDYTSNLHDPIRTRNIRLVGETINTVVKDSMLTITYTHKVREPLPNTMIAAPAMYTTGIGQLYVAPPAPPVPAYRDIIQQKVMAVRLSDLIEYTIE